VYSGAGWRQCPNTGTPASLGFAPFRPTLGWLSAQPKRTPIFTKALIAVKLAFAGVPPELSRYTN